MYWISRLYQPWCLSTPLALFFQSEWTVFACLPGEAVLSAKLLAKKKILRAIFTCPFQAHCQAHWCPLFYFSCVNTIVLYMLTSLGRLM